MTEKSPSVPVSLFRSQTSSNRKAMNKQRRYPPVPFGAIPRHPASAGLLSTPAEAK